MNRNALNLVYFSSVTENTKKMVEKLGFDSHRIPLYPNEPEIRVDFPFILITPTYGLGTPKTAVPKQVVKFLSHGKERELCLGVIGSGNRNFGDKYAVAGRFLAHHLHVPFLYSFELAGNQKDVDSLKEQIPKWWSELMEMRGPHHLQE